MHVHHVARIVIAHRDIFTQLRSQAQVIEGVLRTQIGCRKIEVATGNKYLHVGIFRHRFIQCT